MSLLTNEKYCELLNRLEFIEKQMDDREDGIARKHLYASYEAIIQELAQLESELLNIPINNEIPEWKLYDLNSKKWNTAEEAEESDKRIQEKSTT